MAKRNVLLHIGPTTGAASRQAELEASTALASAGVVVPAVSPHLLDRADLELRRAHKDAGLRRKDVEGAWSRACRQVHRTATRQKVDVAISVPGLVAATPAQAALAVDGLHGLRVHLLATTDRESDLSAWLDVLGTSSLVHHVPVASPRSEDLGAYVAALAVEAEAARVERKLAKWTARHARLGRRLRRVDAA